MAWAIEFLPEAAKELKKLDRKDAARILKTLETRIAAIDDPRTLGKPLKGVKDGYWRWRIGVYRIVGLIRDERVTILVVRIAHRKEVYR
ncbi:MAG: type toxin-antitoxin system mRNA interferase toxin, RelE/StbE family [Alphaproteobacteria bacterium]|nr:type toxin-antitoxin system mRNA interferase toxin, RelE/StbE family [Alphaproteobacteria bacterium]